MAPTIGNSDGVATFTSALWPLNRTPGGVARTVVMPAAASFVSSGASALTCSAAITSARSTKSRFQRSDSSNVRIVAGCCVTRSMSSPDGGAHVDQARIDGRTRRRR